LLGRSACGTCFPAGRRPSRTTELAYLPAIDDAYVREFRARVVALPPGGVVLERTYFYPTGGGQPSDRGTLGVAGGERAEVVDVSKSGASVVHRLQGGGARRPTFAVGDVVEGAIDWERRFRHMRLHTAQHFLSGRIFARTGLRTRKANFGGVRAVLELDGPLGDDVVPALVEDVRSVLAPPRAVAIRHLPRAEWDRHPLSERSGLVPLPPQVDPVRVIEIDGFDLCPCGGTHLRSTGEIGEVAVERAVPLGDGGSRLVFTLAPQPAVARPA
jgi:misacylated tRNA(Ala) deacylase